MQRRIAMLALGTAALPWALAGRPGRADAATVPISTTFYRDNTLHLGSVAKLTSAFVLQNDTAMTPADIAVRRFARLEIIEQTAAAQALTSNFSPPPPTLDPEQQAVVASVENAPADQLAATYVSTQIRGHHLLLALQNELLATITDPADNWVHIALLLRSNIQQHLQLLGDLLHLIDG